MVERIVSCFSCHIFLKVQKRVSRGSNSVELTTASLAKGIRIDQSFIMPPGKPGTSRWNHSFKNYETIISLTCGYITAQNVVI